MKLKDIFRELAQEVDDRIIYIVMVRAANFCDCFMMRCWQSMTSKLNRKR